MSEWVFFILSALPAIVFGTVGVMWWRGDLDDSDDGSGYEPWER